MKGFIVIYVYIILLVFSLFPPLWSKIVLATHFLPAAFLFFLPLLFTGGSSDFYFSCGLAYLNEKQKIIVSFLKIVQQTRHVCFRFFYSIAFHLDLPYNLRNKMAEKLVWIYSFLTDLAVGACGRRDQNWVLACSQKKLTF